MLISQFYEFTLFCVQKNVKNISREGELNLPSYPAAQISGTIVGLKSRNGKMLPKIFDHFLDEYLDLDYLVAPLTCQLDTFPPCVFDFLTWYFFV